MEAKRFILSNTDIDTINDIERLLASGAAIPADMAKDYLRFLAVSLRAQSGETMRVLSESAKEFMRGADSLNRASHTISELQDRLFKLTNGAEGKELTK